MTRHTSGSGEQQQNKEERGRGKRTKRPTLRALAQKSMDLMERADKYMVLVGLPCHWSESDPLFLETQSLVNNQKIRQAIDTLEKLVVQRLFELQKCHVRGTSESIGVNLTIAMTEHLKITECVLVS
jgi:hypothetical protein